jgi:hypothetical protein
MPVDRDEECIFRGLRGGEPKPTEPDSGWDVVKVTKPKRQYRQIPENVEKWNRRELAEYAANRLKEMFNLRFEHGSAYGSIVMGRVRVRMKTLLGRPVTNAEMCEYIDYFFAVHAKEHIVENGEFTLSHLMWPTYLRKFCVTFGPLAPESESKPKRKSRKRNKGPVEPEPSLKPAAGPPRLESLAGELAGVAKVGTRALLLRFGPVLTINYLHMQNKVPLFQAARLAVRESAAAYSADKRYWQSIAEATRKYGPYPSWLPWQDVPLFVETVSGDVGVQLKEIDVEVGKNERLDFLIML